MYNSGSAGGFIPPAGQGAWEVLLADADNAVVLPIPLLNSVGDSTSSMSSAVENGPPLRESSTRRARRLMHEFASEAAVTAADYVASVAIAEKKPAAAVANPDAFA